MSSLVPVNRLDAAVLASFPELLALHQLAQAGFTLAPLRVLAEDAEEQFYRLNNLPAQLTALFAPLDLDDPDEDDLEELSPEAQKLIRAHFLLDEVVDLFYAGLDGLPDLLRVRRLNPEMGNIGVSSAGGRVATRGRPTLLALKEIWADDWSFDALWARLEAEHSVALSARPVLFTASGAEGGRGEEDERASRVVGRALRLLHDPASGITGVQFV